MGFTNERGKGFHIPNYELGMSGLGLEGGLRIAVRGPSTRLNRECAARKALHGLRLPTS